MANFVPVNPDIITWAREYHDLSREQLAEKVGVHINQIIKWEDGQTKPTWAQANDLKRVLCIPFCYLLLSERPQLEDPLPDLRTRRDEPLLELSPNFRDVLYSVLNKHEWYREYALEYGAERLPFVGRYSSEDSPTDVAQDIRKTVSIDEELRNTAKSWSSYLELLSLKAESLGILVMRSSLVGNDVTRKLSADEFQGFVITDKIAPVVFINGDDFVTARIFTLAHELAHIWIGKSGIVNPDEAASVTSSELETFCNHVAAEVLVPQDEFSSAWKASPEPERLATVFRVSEIVIVRRAYELNKINRDQFYALLEIARAKTKNKQKGGRSDSLANIANRNSPLLMDSVIKDVRQGGTMLRDGARLLNMRLPTFMGVAQAGEY